MGKKKDLPAMPFYFGDWRKAPEIRALDLDVRMIWFEMLGFMWESTERGYLTINSKPVITPVIAKMVGVDIKVLEQALKQLEEFSVFSKREDGAIYSRKMVADEEMRKVKSESGKKGMESRYSDITSVITPDITNPEHEKKMNNKEIFKKVPIPKALNTKECLKSIFDWFQYKTDNYKPLVSIIQIERFFKILDEYSNRDPKKAIEIINYSIDGTYPKIYNPKDKSNGEPEKPKRIITKCPECDTEKTRTTIRKDRIQEWICEKGHKWTTKVIPPPMF